MSWSVQDRFSNNSYKDVLITVDIKGNDKSKDKYAFKVDAGGAISVYGQSTDAQVQKALKALTSRKFRNED